MILIPVRHIYSQPLDIRLGELRLHRLSLNRHLPDQECVDPHHHRHGQLLLYLTGNGHQRVDGEIHPVQQGSVFYFAAGSVHSYMEGTGRRPLCLALDLECPETAASSRGVLAQGEMRGIRQWISLLHAWQNGPTEVRPAEAGAVLAILDQLMRSVGLIRNQRKPVTLGIVKRVRGMFRENAENTPPVAAVAGRVGYHPDHLTRLLKRETGMSASQLRASERLQRAKRELAGCRSIAEAGAACGFQDANYFSRWFRLQTGVTPRAWRAGERP